MGELYNFPNVWISEEAELGMTLRQTFTGNELVFNKTHWTTGGLSHAYSKIILQSPHHTQPTIFLVVQF